MKHDQKLETNSVYAMLDAGASFDAGNAAEFLTVKVPSYNEDKPICIKWNKECTDTRSALFDWGLDGEYGTNDLGEGNGIIDEGDYFVIYKINWG